MTIYTSSSNTCLDWYGATMSAYRVSKINGKSSNLTKECTTPFTYTCKHTYACTYEYSLRHLWHLNSIIMNWLLLLLKLPILHVVNGRYCCGFVWYWRVFPYFALQLTSLPYTISLKQVLVCSRKKINELILVL